MKIQVLAALVLGTAAFANAAQITTLYSRNNGGSNGGAVYFDIVTNANNLTFTAIDTNTDDTVAFSFQVWTRTGTNVGFENTAVGWTQVATGNGTGAGSNNPSAITLSNSFTLLAGTTTGVALVMGPEAGHDYSGTGTSPSPGQLTYSNADLTLNLGAASNIPFSGTPFRPRIWNGSLYYTVNAIPEPATMTLVGLGALALIRRRRR